MDWFFDSNLPVIIGVVIGGIIAYPILQRIQEKKKRERDDKTD